MLVFEGVRSRGCCRFNAKFVHKSLLIKVPLFMHTLLQQIFFQGTLTIIFFYRTLQVTR